MLSPEMTLIGAKIKNFAPPAARSVLSGLFGAKVRCRSITAGGNALRAHPPYKGQVGGVGCRADVQDSKSLFGSFSAVDSILKRIKGSRPGTG